MSIAARHTIFALSSGRGPAAIAVIRISGPRAAAALQELGVKVPEPRRAALARVRDPESNEIIDEGLALFFPGPRSETGEDVVELQLHGGRAVVAATFAALGRLEGMRPAEAGEFTRRAFENGKLDLTAVEGLADLVAAETEGQRRQAFRQMKGALGGRAEEWRRKLIQALALIEARIDFADEGDVPEELVGPALAIAGELAGDISAALADARRGERLREGMVVAIAGPPNAGKSTLLNRIARREAAIVSPYAGTTRDVIEVHLDLDGWPVTLLDTAGIRETADPVETEGVRRAQARASAADLVLWVADATAAGVAADNAFGAPVAGVGQQGAREARPPLWLVRNKMDLLANEPSSESVDAGNERNELSIDGGRKNEDASHIKARLMGEPVPSDGRSESGLRRNEREFGISALSGAGVELLLEALSSQAQTFLAGSEAGLVTRERHRRALEETLAALRRAIAPELAGREDLLAEELRLAAHALGRLTGRVDVEDVLDVIFRDFCIGK